MFVVFGGGFRDVCWTVLTCPSYICQTLSRTTVMSKVIAHAFKTVNNKLETFENTLSCGIYTTVYGEPVFAYDNP